jgi:hypothetical protein
MLANRKRPYIPCTSLKFDMKNVLAVRKKLFPPHRNCKERNGYSTGNYLLLDAESAEVWNPARNCRLQSEESTEERNSTGKCQILDREPTGRMEFGRELLVPGRGIHGKNRMPPGSDRQDNKMLPNGNNSRSSNSKA